MKKIYILIITVLLLVNFALLWQHIEISLDNSKICKDFSIDKNNFIHLDNIKLLESRKLNLLILFSDNGCGICARIVAQETLKLKEKYPHYVKILFFGSNTKILKKYGIKEEDIFYKAKNSSNIFKNKHLVREPIIVLINKKMKTILSLVTKPDRKFEVKEFFMLVDNLISIITTQVKNK